MFYLGLECTRGQGKENNGSGFKLILYIVTCMLKNMKKCNWEIQKMYRNHMLYCIACNGT